jgi:transcriptional regulator with XRE-family HTH domain
MTTSETGSTVPRRQLGRYLAELRKLSGLRAEDVAAALEISMTTLWRIESGRTACRTRDARDLCALYGASADRTAELIALAGETKAKGWWASYGDVIRKASICSWASRPPPPR